MATPPRPAAPLALDTLRADIVGIDARTPVLGGGERPYVFLDNAASTPAFGRVLKAVEAFLPWYSAVHRGAGFKSAVATEMFDRCHDVVARFVGADPATNLVVFGKNTTECINKLANRFGFGRDDVVVTTTMEHHSNLLPWRKYANVVHVGVDALGFPRLDELRAALEAHAGAVKLVAITGASNITGICPPIHDIARWAHAAGARIFVDAAQLAPHRRLSMLADDDPGHLDFVAFSAHKLYAPFGTGALVGPVSFFEQGEPDMVGGGVVDIVTLDEVVWNPSRHKEEAGSPNVVGAVALAAAVAVLERVGMDAIAAHEQALLEHAYRTLGRLRGVRLYGPTDRLADKVGVIPFTVDGVPHGLVASILASEDGIGVRSGFFCAQPYVKGLLGIGADQQRETGCGVSAAQATEAGSGMVRASLGCYSTEGDIDALASALEAIVEGRYLGQYDQDALTGAYRPRDYEPPVSRYLSFLDDVEPAVRLEYAEPS
jgi:selenocysteine lyase/cysteine desulfurase